MKQSSCASQSFCHSRCLPPVFSALLLGILSSGCAAGGEAAREENEPSGAPGSSPPGLYLDAGSDANELNPDAACIEATLSAEPVPLDMVVMIDRSGSMDRTVGGSTTTIWEAIALAFKMFVNDDGVKGINVALQFFPVPIPENPPILCEGLCPRDIDGQPIESPNCPCGNGGNCATGPVKFCYGDSCRMVDYATPALDYTELPGGANMFELLWDATDPDGATPTSPALSAAIDHAAQRRLAYPDHESIVVLATDGRPNECFPQDMASINEIAATGLNSTPSVPTYVVGAGFDADLNLLHELAASGGTGQAFVVKTDELPLDTTQAFVDAMNAIRNLAVDCEYLIPAPTGGDPDFGLVNVKYTPSEGEPLMIPKVSGSAACGTELGWYYDDPNHPQHIQLCPALCEQLHADGTSTLEILIGCATIVK